MKTRTIMLVEDNHDDVSRVKRMLKEHPRRKYLVHEYGTAAEALEALRVDTWRFDCVLLDYHLPDMNALEFVEALRKGGATPVAISVLTGRDDDEVASKVIEAGAEDYILKDAMTPASLARTIENVVERFEIRLQLEAQRAAIEMRNQRLERARDELQTKVTELAAATQARDRFVAMMSHEMRTPLNAILGYAELLELEIEGDLTDGQRKHLERIRVGSRHLLDLINDVLDLARAEAGKLELDIRPVDVSAVLDEIHALLENQARQRHLDFVVQDPAADLPHMLADLQRLRQIVMNLAGNAIKFTERGQVRISAGVSADGNSVCVIVTDTGIGMTDEVLAQVFTEFYQGDNALTRPYGGSGLGLSISRRLARAMGGEISVTSEPGTGSTFVLTLPRASADILLRPEDVARHDSRMAMHSSPTERTRREPVNVAAFADNVDALDALAEQVKPTVQLEWTTSEDDLPGLVVRTKAALVILDAASRDGAAWRAAHAIAALPDEKPPAILLLPTIVASPDAPATPGVDLGWVSLVPKPFTAGQLTRAVSAAAGRDDEEQAKHRLEVLVIDDDEDSRRVAGKFLSEIGFRVRESSDGESGLTEMRMRPADVVVLDLMMPVLDGFGVLAAMRADPLIAGIPVVVLTAKTLTEAERQFLARTAVRVLQKGEHRLADIAALVLRAATRARGI